MQNGIHFISGLPRSGSTLLAAILLQNQALHAGISSAVGSLVGTMLKDVSQGNEASAMIDDTQREVLLRGLFDGYYHAIHPNRTVFDTNRGWTARLSLLTSLFPDAKIICCVRHIPWIVDSVERMLRKNHLELSKMFGFDTGGNVYTRAELLTSRTGFIGYPLGALKEAMHSTESDRLLILPYDVLTKDPSYAMEAVYGFTGLPFFKHDFENIAFDATEFDARLGMRGLHTVRPRAHAVERQSILPPDLWARYEQESIWRDPKFNVRGVRIA